MDMDLSEIESTIPNFESGWDSTRPRSTSLPQTLGGQTVKWSTGGCRDVFANQVNSYMREKKQKKRVGEVERWWEKEVGPEDTFLCIHLERTE